MCAGSIASWRLQDLADPAGDRVGGEGFGEIRDARLQHAVAGDRAVGVTGHVEDAQAGTRRADHLRELAPVGIGHDDIGQQQVDVSLRTPRDVQRGAATIGLQHGVSLAGERAMCQPAQLLVVLHDQHRASAAWQGLGGRDFADVLGQRGNRRKIDLECRPFAWFTVEPDVAAGLFYDAVYGRQTKARAASGRLGGEEGLEDPRLRLLVHAAARVADGEHDIFAWDHRDMLRRVRVVEGRVARFDRDSPALGHRVPRVDREIHDDLLDLVRIGACRREVVRQDGLELDVLGDQRPQHLIELHHYAVYVDDARLQHLLA